MNWAKRKGCNLCGAPKPGGWLAGYTCGQGRLDGAGTEVDKVLCVSTEGLFQAFTGLQLHFASLPKHWAVCLEPCKVQKNGAYFLRPFPSKALYVRASQKKRAQG